MGGKVYPDIPRQTNQVFARISHYVIRNYWDAFPAEYFDKDFKDWGKVEQTNEEVWRMVHNTWFDNGSVQNWICPPLWWKQAEY